MSAARSSASAPPPTGAGAADFVVFIVPERHHRVRRYHVRRRSVQRACAAAILAVAMAAVLVVHYAYTVSAARQVPALLADNVALGVRLVGIEADVARLDEALSHIDKMTAGVRAITQLNDPARNLAIGPLKRDATAKGAQVLYAQGERIDFEDEVMDSKLALRLIEEGLDATGEHMARTAHNVKDLSAYLDAQPALWPTTPSLRPVRSHLISGAFGVRQDPFTGQQVMHKGIDFIADYGAEVIAPADGRVIFAGSRGAGYGETLVLDHGFGVQTHFAHLSRLDVAVGALVARGDKVAAVGHSGRAMGAHLHYEVRYNGLPYDPSRFLLDE